MPTPGVFLDEERAVKVVLEAIEDGLARMHATADRILARRSLSAADWRFLGEMEDALTGLAREVADQAVYGGQYGDLLKKAYAAGAKFGGGGMIALDSQTVLAALWPARLKIKDLAEVGAQSITELTARSITAGWSQRELSERIQAEVVLAGPDGSPYSVPEWRAELQARNEPMKVYRSAAAEDWTDETLLEMVGPDDARTAGDVCSEYLGKVMTLAEWREVGADPQGYGFHPN